MAFASAKAILFTLANLYSTINACLAQSFSLGTAPTGAFRSATERSEALGAEMKLAKIFDF
jgi:hypothetical protein